MHRRTAACAAALVLVVCGFGHVLGSPDLTTIPVDRAALAAKVGASKVGLAQAIEAAEKSAGGKAANAAMQVVEGKLEITVEVVAANMRKAVKVNAETGKVDSTEDLPTQRFKGWEVSGEPTKTASGLMYYDVKVGDGDSPRPTSTVKVDYTGWLTTGEKFDSSIDRGEPATFPLRNVIKGWTEGLGTMKVGGKRKLVVPYQLAYWPRARPPVKAMLIFDVELLDIVKK